MERLWTRPFIQLTAALLFLFTGFYLLLPTLPLFITEHLGGTDADVGLIVGVFTIAAVILRPIAGGLIDRFGRRAFVLGGIVLFTAATYSYGAVGSIAVLISLRVLHGVGWAVSTTAASTAVTDIIPVPRRGEGMGWYGMAMTIAMGIGPMVGVWLIDNYAFRGLFVAAAGLSVLAFLLAASTPMPFQRVGGGHNITLYDRSLLPIMAAVAFLTLAYGGVSTFVPLFAQGLSVNPGAFFLVYAATITVVRPFAGTLSDRRGEAAVIVPATALVALALFVLAHADNLTGMLLAAVLYGIGFGAAQPALQAATLRIAGPARMGVANASFFTAFDLGIGIGSIALGWVSQFMGYRVLFIVCAVGAIVSLAIFIATVQRNLRQDRAIHLG